MVIQRAAIRWIMGPGRARLRKLRNIVGHDRIDGMPNDQRIRRIRGMHHIAHHDHRENFRPFAVNLLKWNGGHRGPQRYEWKSGPWSCDLRVVRAEIPNPGSAGQPRVHSVSGGRRRGGGQHGKAAGTSFAKGGSNMAIRGYEACFSWPNLHRFEAGTLSKPDVGEGQAGRSPAIFCSRFT